MLPLIVTRSALGQVPLQAGAHAGAECFDDCGEYGFGLGLDMHWVAGRVGALGLLVEYVDTTGEDRTGTWRFGPALRAYFSRSTLLEPYVHLAVGVPDFTDKSAACDVEAVVFTQLAVGVEANVAPKSFVGISLGTTAQGYAMSCGDVRGTNWNTGPMFGLMLTARFGPDMPATTPTRQTASTWSATSW